jgi:hypothetical protein
MGPGIGQHKRDVDSRQVVANRQKARASRDVVHALFLNTTKERKKPEKKGPKTNVQPNAKLPAMGFGDEHQRHARQDKRNGARHQAKEHSNRAIDSKEQQLH